MSDNRNRAQKPNHSPITTGKNSKQPSFRKRAETAPTWDSVPAKEVHALVCACTTRNASPTFSYTRDGSALVVAIYFHDQRYVDYLNGPEEFSEYLHWLFVELLDLSPQEQAEYLQDNF